MKRYTEQHEWIDLRDGEATVGISVHAAHELGDITFVELPEVGTDLGQGDIACAIESVKAAEDIYSPAAGTVCAVNRALEEAPELVNEAPETKGWIYRLSGVSESDLAGLMSEADYDAYLHA